MSISIYPAESVVSTLQNSKQVENISYVKILSAIGHIFLFLYQILGSAISVPNFIEIDAQEDCLHVHLSSGAKSVYNKSLYIDTYIRSTYSVCNLYMPLQTYFTQYLKCKKEWPICSRGIQLKFL